MKICTKCNKKRRLSSFGKGNDKNRLSYFCLDCDKKRTKQYRIYNPDKINEQSRNWKKKYPGAAHYYWIKHRAKRRSHIFEFTRKEFEDWYNDTPKICEYCGTSVGKISIDRIIPQKGYVSGNLVFACIKCNLIKSDILSYDEMKEIAEKYIKPKLKIKIHSV